MAPLAREFLECSWGKIRLFASQVHTDGGRTQVVHELSSGDEHPVQDRGLRVRRVRLRLQFDDFPNSPSPVEAARALEAAKNSGQIAVFQHPMLGRYEASIGDFTSEIDESSVISAEAEFIQESADQPITPTGAASSGTAGESSVAAAAVAMDDELAKVGQLKMSDVAASALLARVPGGVSFARVRGTIDLTVSRSSAFVSGLLTSVKANADAVSAEAAAFGAVPIVTEFAAGGALAALRPLAESSRAGLSSALDPVAEQVTKAKQSITGDPSNSLAALAASEAQQGLFAATTMDARVAVSNWNTGSIPMRQVTIDAARVSNNIAVMIEVGGFENDLALWPAFRAAIMLGNAVRDAAIAATSRAPSVFVMRIMQETALLPLAARIYGGAAASDFADQIASLNDISTPGWLPPGDYLLPIRPPAASF